MPAPKLIFIDTCIFDAYHYNFQSQDLKALVEKRSRASIVILMPAPTINEIHRHIKLKSDAVQKGFKAAQKEASFLTKISFWPDKEEQRLLAEQVEKAARAELNEFLVALSVSYLNYKGVSVEEVMSWHQQKKAAL